MKTSSTSPWQGRILFRLSLASKAHNILELGSSLGISQAYLSLANKKAKVLSIEGDPKLAALSRKNMEALLISNSRIIEGAFDDKLEQCLNELNGVDLAFIDGNHKYEPSLNYFNQILPYCHSNTILVFDDIYWSSEMKRAWNKIITDSRVSASVNLFHFGIVLFDQKMHGHHHILPKLF